MKVCLDRYEHRCMGEIEMRPVHLFLFRNEDEVNGNRKGFGAIIIKNNEKFAITGQT